VTVQHVEPDGWLVRGELTLHGQTHVVTLNVAVDQGRYRGSASLKQTDFGMSPISVAGGAVKVKDEVKIDFDIAAGSRPTVIP
jgi:polyisoprenoid-binding protein YceI